MTSISRSSVLPPEYLQALSNEHVQAKHLTVKRLPIDLGAQTRPVAIFTLKNRTLSPIAELFLQSVRTVAKSMVAER